MPSVRFGGHRVDYAIVRGVGHRCAYFRFRPDMTLEVVLPKGGKVDVQEEIRARLPWILRQSDRMAGSRKVLGHDHVMFGGRSLRLVFLPGVKEGLAPNLDTGEVVVGSSDRRVIRELVRRWFLKESSAYVVKKVAEFAPRLGAKPRRVDVREISKWGYCTRTGRLSFSWQLAALSERLREYVVLHELTHLAEFNHSAAFRKRLSRFCPDYRDREKELDLVVPYDRLKAPV